MSTDDHTTDTTTIAIPFTQHTIGQDVQETVNARDLHGNLAIGKDYTNWIKAQIKSLQLIENVDFITFAQKGERKEGLRGATISTEYFLTLDTAKHVALASRTAKGREIRDYFIAAEKRLRQGAHVLPSSQTQILENLLALSRRQDTLTQAQEALAKTQAAQQQTQAAQQQAHDTLAARLDVLDNRHPPAGKLRPEDWLRRHSKPYLPRDVLRAFRAACRQIEAPEMFRPEGTDYATAYFSPYTLAAAYAKVTRQLTFFGGEHRTR